MAEIVNDDDRQKDVEAGEEDGTLSTAAAQIAALMDDEEASGAEAAAPAADPAPPAAPEAAKPPQMDAAITQATLAAQQAMAERDRLAQALQAVVPQMQTALAGEFADIRSIEDVERMGRTDPDRYNRYVFAQARLQQAQATQRVAQAQQQRTHDLARAAWQSSEQDKLNQAIPELTEPGTGPVLARRLQAFALSNGYTPQDLAQAGARDFVTLHKAMRLADIEAAQGKARDKARGAPPVQQPGTRGGGGGDRFRGDLERLQKSGRVDDAALVFQNLLSR